MVDVRSGKADFGVCASGVVLPQPGQGKAIVLGVIFQHSAANILVPSRTRINALSELTLAELDRRYHLRASVQHGAVMAAMNADDMAGLPSVQRDALEIALLRAEPTGRLPDERTLSVATS